jgi:hypothetical protein
MPWTGDLQFVAHATTACSMPIRTLELTQTLQLPSLPDPFQELMMRCCVELSFESALCHVHDFSNGPLPNPPMIAIDEPIAAMTQEHPPGTSGT